MLFRSPSLTSESSKVVQGKREIFCSNLRCSAILPFMNAENSSVAVTAAVTATTSAAAVDSNRVQMYLQIEEDLQALTGGRADFPFRSALVSLIALLKERHSKISWVGAYMETHPGTGHLFIDAYQGKVACVEIPKGKGVCGASFEQKVSLIVPNVDAFPGHIACDSLSRSEIVLPLRHNGQWIGVLDLDSHELDAFQVGDELGLNRILNTIENLP